MDGKMLAPFGRLLRPVRPGPGKLSANRFNAPREILLTSPAFNPGGRLPDRFTADGQRLSPPLSWTGLPEAAASLLLLVEDIDAPFPRPLVHALVYDINPELTGLDEGALPARLPGAARQGFRCGRNSDAAPGWMPPAPVPGHGPHRYVFQIFALSRPPDFAHLPGRGLMLRTVRGSVLSIGLLSGIYERG